MIDLYGMGSPNVLKIYIALEEMVLPYKAHPIDVFKGEQFTETFLSLNPNAKVPVIVDPDGPGRKRCEIFESGAILIYLADKTGQFLETRQSSRYETLQWLMVQLTGQGPMSGQMVHFTRFAPPGNEYPLARYRTQVLTVYQKFENRLSMHPFLGGENYTIADMAAFPWSRHDAFREIVEARYPNVTRWANQIESRPAVRRALKVAAQTHAKLSTWNRVTAKQLDRFLARGPYEAK